MDGIGSEHFEFAIAGLLGVLDAIAKIIELGLHSEPAFLVIDGPAKVSDEPVHFVFVEQHRLDLLTR